MVAKLMLLRPQYFPLTVFLFPRCFFPKPSSSLTASFFSSSAAVCAAKTTTICLCSTLSYGPSLEKGYKPSKNCPNFEHKLQQDHYGKVEEIDLFNEDNFTRVFDIAALRVPSDQCFALENRLRGHLLNWPRVRNIARVPGDEIEDEFKSLVKSNLTDDSDSLVSFNRRIYGKGEGDGEPLSPVLYRDKLVHTFNSRGFVNFKNLAKMSRPKKRKKKEVVEEKGRREKKGIGRNELYMVEVEEEEGELEGEDLSGLLGDDFNGRKWRGSTRLLLLDECYASKAVDKMPEAIKVSVPTF